MSDTRHGGVGARRRILPTPSPECGILWTPVFERAAAGEPPVPGRPFDPVVIQPYDIRP